MKSEELYELTCAFNKLASDPASRFFSKFRNMFTEEAGEKQHILSKMTDMYRVVNEVELALTSTSDLKQFPQSFYKWITFLTFFDLNVVEFLKRRKGTFIDVSNFSLDKDKENKISFLIEQSSNKFFKNKLKSLNHYLKIKENQQAFDQILSKLNDMYGTSNLSLDELVNYSIDNEPIDNSNLETKDNSFKDTLNKLKVLIGNVKDKKFKLKLYDILEVYKVNKSEDLYDKIIYLSNSYFNTDDLSLDELLDYSVDNTIEFDVDPKPEKKDNSFRDNLNKLKVLIDNVKDDKVKSKLSGWLKFYKVNKSEDLYDKMIVSLNNAFNTNDLSLDELLDYLSYKEDESVDSVESGLSLKQQHDITAQINLLLRKVEDEEEKLEVLNLLSIFESKQDQESYKNLIDFINDIFEEDGLNLEEIMGKHANVSFSIVKESKAPIQRWLNRTKLTFFEDEIKSAKKDLADMLNSLAKKIDKYMSKIEKRSVTIDSSSKDMSVIMYEIMLINRRLIKMVIAYNSYARISPESTDKPIPEQDMNKLKKINEKLEQQFML